VKDNIPKEKPNQIFNSQLLAPPDLLPRPELRMKILRPILRLLIHHHSQSLRQSRPRLYRPLHHKPRQTQKALPEALANPRDEILQHIRIGLQQSPSKNSIRRRNTLYARDQRQRLFDHGVLAFELLVEDPDLLVELGKIFAGDRIIVFGLQEVGVRLRMDELVAFAVLERLGRSHAEEIDLQPLDEALEGQGARVAVDGRDVAGGMEDIVLSAGDEEGEGRVGGLETGGELVD
jgi:hypothetical protein